MTVEPRFIPSERQRQAAFFQRSVPVEALHPSAAYRLSERPYNVAPSARATADAYFNRYGITWHRHANHGLSSQVCCLNFLMPLATRRDLLSRLIGDALGIAPPEMLRIEDGPDGEPWFVGFEWIGREDYLGEAGKSSKRTRGANVTSADAIVRFKHDGRTETLLIEWKYTESYGAPIPNKPRKGGGWSNDVRIERYSKLAFAPHGPIRADLGLKIEDFFWEPFYQLLRQQMLAFQMQKAGEDGADRVRVLHISPSGNRNLHKVTAPALRCFGEDAFEAFSAVLVQPDGFIGRTAEQMFAPLVAELADDPWAAYLADRYAFLSAAAAV